MFTKTNRRVTNISAYHHPDNKITAGARFLALGLLFLTGLAFTTVASTARAVPLKDTSTSGNWGIDGNWTGGDNLAPVSGESVNIDLSMQVTAATPLLNRVFGDGAENSTWSGGTSVVTIDPGIQLENVAGSTLVVTGASPFLAGAGTFLNSGTIEHRSPRFLYLNGGSTTLDNAGTFEFRGTTGNSDLVMFNTLTPSFINNGDVVINMDSPTDLARLESENRIGNGVFTQLGNPVTFTQGTFVFAPPGGIGATLTDAAFATHFGAINANSELRLAGGVDIDLDSTVTDLSRVYLGSTSAASIQPKPGMTPTTIKVTNAGIRTASGNPIANTGAAGDTIVNLADSKIVVANNGGQFFINGNGAFVNQGTMELENHRFIVGVSGDTELRNEKDIIFTQDNSRLLMWTGSPEVNNMPGGKLSIQLPNATDIATIGTESGDLNNGYLGEYHNQGGSPIEFVKGTLIFAPPGGIGGTLDDAEFANLFGARNADSTLKLGGGISNIVLTGATDLSRVRLSDNSQDLTVPVGGTTINVTAPGGIRTSDGVARISIITGRTATNLGELVLSSGNEFYINGDGTFDNQGTLVIENNRFLLGVTDSPTLSNSGTIKMTENGSRIDLWLGSPSFNNLAGALVEVNLPLGTDRAEIGRDSQLTSGGFDNLGTIDILQGELEIEAGIAVPFLSGGTSLDTGTWRISSSGPRARLDILAGGTSPGSIDTIGANASLLMGGADPQFPQLSSTSLNVDGTFAIHDSLIYGLTGLTMGTDGVLEFGLQGLDEGGTLSTGIQVVGAVSFDDTQIDIVDLGGVGVGTFRLMEFTSATGLAVLGDSPDGYNFTLVQGFDFLDLTVVEIPEPSSFLLLSLGALGMMRHTRRRRASV